MATPRWIGASLNKRQLDTLLISGAGAANDTLTLTIDNVDFAITVGGTTTTAGIAQTVKEAFNGEALADTTASATVGTSDRGAQFIPQFSEFTATLSGSTITFTGNGTGALAGKPITMAGTKSGTVTITYTANATTPTSQYHANQADNYSTNVVPANDDTLIFDAGNIDMRYQLSLGVQLAALKKFMSYSGNVGLPEYNIDNAAKQYHEYRNTYLVTNNNTVTCRGDLELGSGKGSRRFKWDYGAGRTDVYVYGKAERLESGVPCILLKGSHASNTLTNLAGDVGLAFFLGETAVYAAIASGDGPQSDAQTYCGVGCTLATVRLNGGSIQTNSAVTTATAYSGTWDHYGGSTIATLDLLGKAATWRPHAACTVTNATIYGKLDLSEAGGTVTFTNLVQFYEGAELYDPDGRAVFSAGYKINCPSDKFKVTRPPGDTVTYS